MPERPTKVELRETYRNQLVQSIGGWTGTVITAIPPVVFVIVNATAGLRPAIVSAIATGMALAGYRLARKQSTQQAISGLFGVVVAALIAARTGQARGYFLLGIWSSFLYAVPFAVSLVIRRPLIGWLWEFLDPSRQDPRRAEEPWYRRAVLLRAYMIATAIGTVLFLARGIVQATLYHDNSTGWLAFARVAMGYPLYIAAVGAGFWIVRRARRSYEAGLPQASAAEPGVGPDAVDAPATEDRSADDRAADRGLGLG